MNKSSKLTKLLMILTFASLFFYYFTPSFLIDGFLKVVTWAVVIVTIIILIISFIYILPYLRGSMKIGSIKNIKFNNSFLTSILGIVLIVVAYYVAISTIFPMLFPDFWEWYTSDKNLFVGTQTSATVAAVLFFGSFFVRKRGIKYTMWLIVFFLLTGIDAAIETRMEKTDQDAVSFTDKRCGRVVDQIPDDQFGAWTIEINKKDFKTIIPPDRSASIISFFYCDIHAPFIIKTRPKGEVWRVPIVVNPSDIYDNGGPIKKIKDSDEIQLKIVSDSVFGESLPDTMRIKVMVSNKYKTEYLREK